MPTRRVRDLTSRLGARLVVAFGLALLPLAILAYAQAERVQSEANERTRAAIFGETLLAASTELAGITFARGTAATLAAAVPALLARNEDCIAAMRGAVAGHAALTFAGFIPLDGNMVCASTGEPRSFAGSPGLADLTANPRPHLNVNPRGPISGESVLIYSHPVRHAEGALLGFVSVSMAHRKLSLREAVRSGGTTPLALITFDAEGTVLTSFYGMDTVAERLPVDIDLAALAGSDPAVFGATVASGEERVFAVVPLVPGSLYALSAWSVAEAGGVIGADMPLWLFPALMWLASLIVAWLAAEHQVLRHVRGLKRSVTAFAGGSRRVAPLLLRGAPAELRDMGEAQARMFEAVMRDEAALEDMVHQKEVLLREVHHRVKNNLQLIASIMSIQMRKTGSGEARTLMKGLHDRVLSLATVHRELYQTSGLTDVRADELLGQIIAQVLRMGELPGHSVSTTTALDPIRLTPDQSVPLSLILTEALTNALKYGGRGPDGRMQLEVALTAMPGDRARLRVANSVAADPVATAPEGMAGTGLGEQLLRAFALQLGGTLETGQDDGGYSIEVEFPVRPLAEAEERFGPREEGGGDAPADG